MSKAKRMVIVALAVVAAGSGCDGCRCTGSIPVELKSPPDAEVSRLVIERLKTSDELATTACGVPAKGLTEVKVTPKKLSLKVLGQGLVRVEGKPIGASAPALCTAVVSYLIFTTTDGKGGPPTYTMKGDLGLYAVETPGVKWERPSSGGGDWD